MNVIDLIIIYLACGSPFGVYQITNRKNDRQAVNWLNVFSSFLLWPVFAIALLAKHVFRSGDSTAAIRHNHLEDIRSEIERIAFSDGTISALFEFREIFYRFTGLVEAANAPTSGRSLNEVFDSGPHNNNSLAARCLARRNRERLAFHQTRARNEFVDVISRMVDSGPSRDEILNLALQLAGHLHDRDSAADLNALLTVQPSLRLAAEHRGEACRVGSFPQSSAAISPLGLDSATRKSGVAVR